MERFNCIFSLGGPYLFTCHCKRSIKPLLKSTARFEDCWKKKVQQGPQLWQTVLNQNSINKNNNYDITIMEHFQFFVSGPTINPHSSRLNNFKFLVVLAKPWFTVAHLWHLTWTAYCPTGHKKCAIIQHDRELLLTDHLTHYLFDHTCQGERVPAHITEYP